jgi:hypothetical protein
VAVVVNMIGDERLDLNSAIGLARGDNIRSFIIPLNHRSHSINIAEQNKILRA